MNKTKYLICYKIYGWDYSSKKEYNNIDSMIYECEQFNETEMKSAIEEIKTYEKNTYDMPDVWIHGVKILMFSKL